MNSLSQFNGGIHLAGHKDLATNQGILPASLPTELVLPVQQHIGEAAKPCVEVGQTVAKGDTIATASGFVSASIHAPTSGKISAIEERNIPHPSGLTGLCIVLTPDNNDTWTTELNPVIDYKDLEPVELRNKIREAGIVGLGGAAFPSFIKLNPGPDAVIHTLLVNGAECEPYISCDDMVMREQAEKLIAGAEIVRHAIQARRVVFAIEDNKPLAISAIKKALGDKGNDYRVVTVPTIYPTGGEKQLIKVVTGKEVPSGGLPAQVGVVCHNVGTLTAVYDAVALGKPLISRVVTVTGPGISSPANYEVLIGTPINHLVTLAGGYTDKAERLIMGGPMMGFALFTDEIPIVKATNCILAADTENVADGSNTQPCIRCGDCASACPVNLLPQQLYWHAKAKDFDRTQEYHLFDCIECGCCSAVCPSQIPLVQYYRFAKSEIFAAERERKKSDTARQRHEFRQDRIDREKAEKDALRKKKKAALAKAKEKEQAAKAEPKPDAAAPSAETKAE